MAPWISKAWRAIYNSFVEWNRAAEEAEQAARRNCANAIAEAEAERDAAEATLERLQTEGGSAHEVAMTLRTLNAVRLRLVALRRAQRW